MPRVLIVTDDSPPRIGDIQPLVYAIATRLPPEKITVYAPNREAASVFDQGLSFPVVRHPGSLMLPVAVITNQQRIMSDVSLLPQH